MQTPPTKTSNNLAHTPKYIFVTGGVMSGLGKGVTTASTSKLLQLTGLKVTCVKIDPYLNVDAGTMNPIIHGEVFVTDDSGETDMDIGTYERFLNQDLTRDHNITTGQIYRSVIEDERKGGYLGRCVQIIPHITDEIKRRIRGVGEKTGADVLVVECGGTVGDIESLPFLEAFRQMRIEGASNTLFIHVTLAPILEAVGEQKTKPTQHSVQELRRIGIQPDIIVVRSETPLSQESKNKIAMFSSVENWSVISNPDVKSIYEVPISLEKEGILSSILGKLRLKESKVSWGSWKKVAESHCNWQDEVTIAMVGKYVTLADSYVSVNEALADAGAALGTKVKVNWIDSEKYERNSENLSSLREYHGILVPGGFGSRGTEGIILAANYARENKLPYLGLCFGFQLAIVSFARHVCGFKNAHSTEIDPDTPEPVIDLLPEQRELKDLGATMRLGGHDIEILEGTLAHTLYGNTRIRERHRHRFELNQKYLPMIQDKGMLFSGFSDHQRRAEILEIPGHPFYLATQFHPEFISRPDKPEPVFQNFIKAATERKIKLLA